MSDAEAAALALVILAGLAVAAILGRYRPR